MLKAKPDAKETASRPAVTIDYPKEGEQIFPGHYAIRIAVSGAGAAEVSINEGPWLQCRESNGFFWFDWWPTGAGKQKISARPVGGNAKKGVTRKCTVVAPNKN